MSALTRWSPLRDLEDMHGRLNRLLGRSGESSPLADADWAPLVDITEDEKEYVIKADLPEIPKEHVKVSVENGMLLITGERTLEKEDKDLKYHRIERAYGSFSRSFSLPEDADPTKVEARFLDGVLQVHLGKSENAQPKRFDVPVT